MKWIAKTFLASLILFCLAGCMHTVIGGQGKESPDKNFRVYVESHGRSGHAYTDYTVKKVGISIEDVSKHTATKVFGKWAVLRAADLSTSCMWEDTSCLRIVFFERKGLAS